MSTTEVELDGRRRTSLAKVGRKQDRKYLAETKPDGTIILTPAVTISALELAALRDPVLRDRIERSASLDPRRFKRRGSFASDADG
jgi:hypothetical protein